MSHTQYYRNKTAFNNIESEALWELRDGFLILVDDDLFERVNFEESKANFYAVPDPFPEGYQANH